VRPLLNFIKRSLRSFQYLRNSFILTPFLRSSIAPAVVARL
jgi:hypothetical protein